MRHLNLFLGNRVYLFYRTAILFIFKIAFNYFLNFSMFQRLFILFMSDNLSLPLIFNLFLQSLLFSASLPILVLHF